MGKTTNGLPYPEPTDQVSAGADAIRALAETLRFWTFPHTWASMTSTMASVDITYPTGLFTATPVAIASSGHSYAIFNALPYATYVRLYIRSSSTTSYSNVQTFVLLVQPTI